MKQVVSRKFQFSSVAQSCLNLCDPMDYSTPGLPVYHQLPEFTQTHVHWVGDATQPSHPLSSLVLLPSIFPSIGVFSNESVLWIRFCLLSWKNKIIEISEKIYYSNKNVNRNDEKDKLSGNRIIILISCWSHPFKWQEHECLMNS